MSKVRVYELAKELGMDSKAVLAKLQDMGEFVRSASSTIEAPVARRLKEALPPVPEGESKPAKKVAKKAVKKAAAPAPDPAEESAEVAVTAAVPAAKAAPSAPSSAPETSTEALTAAPMPAPIPTARTPTSAARRPSPR